MENKELNKKTLATIEKEALTAMIESNATRKTFIELLFYLESTNRFREDPMHKNSSFRVYLRDKFCLTYHTYRTERTAFIQFPVEAKKYGPGSIARIQRNCGGQGKIPKVLKAIEKKQATLKTPMRAEQIEKVVKQYEKPHKRKPVAECQNCLTLKKKLDDAQATITEQAGQIEKLKKTVFEYKEYKNVFNNIKMTTIPKPANEMRAQ